MRSEARARACGSARRDRRLRERSRFRHPRPVRRDPRSEEERVDFLETQLDLIPKVGIENYIQLQSGHAE